MQAALIFPHQLFEHHPALTKANCVYLLEESLLFGSDPRFPLQLHRQKLIFHRASMQAYAETLRKAGHEVHYLMHSSGKRLFQRLLEEIPSDLKTLQVCDPCDEWLLRDLHSWARQQHVTLKMHESPSFLSPMPWLEQVLPKGNKPLMANFYRAQRLRLHVLLDENLQPQGGQWSFDVENRRKLPKKYPVPEPLQSSQEIDLSPIKIQIRNEFPTALGTDHFFDYPLTHESSLLWLDQFLKERFAQFGDFEDAISSEHRTLFHSQLTPMLNSGLLTPQQVLDASLAFAQSHEIPLNSLEGFIRQIIGWREFMRGMYLKYGSFQRRQNFWQLNQSLPVAFYTGQTGIPPLDDVIHRVLDHAYAHHIERLMILGCFMLLCRIHPDAVYRWFMELFIDAYDWVMVPNVYGMSQFADGGLFTTKPYLCGSNYILKMSNYPKGEWCSIWDGLYWSFIDDYQEVFAKNPRLSMMAQLIRKMPVQQRLAHRDQANQFLRKIGLAPLPTQA